jgi:cyclopropane-fatty-acyl-phospholipid synthase
MREAPRTNITAERSQFLSIGSTEPGNDGWFDRFCQQQILGLLTRMQRGRLIITLPHGQTIVCGQSGPAAAKNWSSSAAHVEAQATSENTGASASGAPFIQAEIKVARSEFFRRTLLFGDIGLAESYMDGLWETDDIRAVISWMLLNIEDSPVLNESGARSRLLNAFGACNQYLHRRRSNTLRNSKSNIEAHYDLGNDFFKIFLDRSMTYSSALFPAQAPQSTSAEQASLTQEWLKNEGPSLSGAAQLTADQTPLYHAQLAKYARLASKMRIQACDHVLEIGCGWGGFSIYAASLFQCRITAITISQEQFSYVTRLVAEQKLGHLIDVQLIDYRKVQGRFDKIVSIEMIEAVGDEHIDQFFACCNRLLRENGLLGLQMITSPDSRYDTLRKNVDFIQKHIFPGSLLPSLRRITQAMEKSGDLYLYDLHDMGASYVATLRQWQINFNERLPQVQELGFDERFVRTWNYYFSYCQAAFDMRNITAVQAVYTRPNNWRLRD